MLSACRYTLRGSVQLYCLRFQVRTKTSLLTYFNILLKSTKKLFVGRANTAG